MSRRTLTRTAPILDEADRFQNMLDWELFTMEQNNKLWGYNPEVEWVPGDPIYQDPRGVFRFEGCGCVDCGNENELEGYYGHHVRPMIQEFDQALSYQAMKCKTCDVSWGDSEDTCWMCGTKYERPSFNLFEQPIFHVSNVRADEYGMRLEMYIRDELSRELGEHWRRILNQQMNQFSIGMEMASYAAADAAATMRGFSAMFSVVDEPYSIQEYVPPHTGHLANPNRSPFEQPDVVGPVWGTAALYDPRDEPVGYARNRIQLPENWAELSSAVPLPEVPEPRDYSQVQDEIYWRAANPQLTERRRS